MAVNWRTWLTVSSIVVVGACRGSGAPGSASGPAPGVAMPLAFAVPGRANSAPSVAAFGKRIAVVWTATAESTSDIYLSVSTDTGATFGAPVRVNDVEGEVRASGEQPARVVVNKTIHVVWPARIDGRPVIRYARSDNDGRSFSKAETVAGDGRPGARGWEAITLGHDGSVQLVWLDGRNDTSKGMRHHRGPAPAPAKTPMKAGGRGPRQDIFHASWKDDAPRAERPVAANVCFCCKPAIATAGPQVYVAFRHLFPEGIRDIAVARSTDNGVTFGAPARLSEDNWKIDACPDDGPAMVADSHGGIHVVWPTLMTGDTPRKGIFYASLADNGTFTPRLRLDSGDTDPAHPQIGTDDHGNTAVVWDERAAGARRVVLRHVSQGVAQPPEFFPGDGVTYPVAAAAEGYWIILWSADGAAIQGRRLPFKAH